MTTLLNKMKQISGVVDASYNFEAMTLAIYYNGDLEQIKILVADKIGCAMLHNSIEMVNYYSVEKEGSSKENDEDG